MKIALQLLFPVILFLTAFSSVCTAEQPTSIGLILPLTGDMSAVGSACRDAALMALEDARGQTQGEYRLVIEDDRLMATDVAKAAQKLISVDRVDALISTWSYGGQIVAPLAERARIPHIGVAWDERVAKGDYNFLYLTPPSEFMRRFLEVFKELGIKKVALLGIEESGSVFALSEFTRLAPEYGVSVVFRESVAYDTRDFNTLVTRIAAVKPEYLLFNIGGDSLISLLLKSLRAQKVPFKVTAITAYDVLSDLKDLDGSWYVSDSYLPDDFATRFSQRYGHTLRYGIGNYYEAVRLLILAFEAKKSGNSHSVIEKLQSISSYPSIFGLTSVNSEGIFTYPARYMKIEKGKRMPAIFDEIVRK